MRCGFWPPCRLSVHGPAAHCPSAALSLALAHGASTHCLHDALHSQDFRIDADANGSHAMRVPESDAVVETADTVSYSSLLDLQVSASLPVAPSCRCVRFWVFPPTPPLHAPFPPPCRSASQYMPNHVLEHLEKMSFTDYADT